VGFSFLEEKTWTSDFGIRAVAEVRERAEREKAGKNNR